MSKTRNCLLCKKDAQFSPEFSNRAVGEMFGVSKDTVRRHRAHMSTDPFFNVPQDQITSRGITRRLEDGSYEKITWKPNAGLKMALETTAPRDLESLFTAAPVSPDWTIQATPMTKVVSVADLQIGGVDEDGGTEDTIKRVRQSLANICAELETCRPKELVIIDNGDILENFNNVSTQAQTNDLSLTEQIRTARRLFAEIIKTLSGYAERVVILVVSSNHCRVRITKGAPASSPSDDFGIDISYAIEEQLRENPAYDHVTFMRPENDFHEHVIYHSDISNTTIGAIHGHQVTKYTNFPQWLDNMAAERTKGFDKVDVLVVGHFHTYYVLPARGGRYVIGAPTQDNGSSWFTNNTGISSGTGFLMFSLINGKFFSPNIY